MFKINSDKSIFLTRGDIATFNISAKNNDTDYVFEVGDKVRFKVYEKKDCNCVVLQKDFKVDTEGTTVEIWLDGHETKIGEVISKPKDYWYEVELNPETAPQTIIGFDDIEGAKIFRLFPEGSDINV